MVGWRDYFKYDVISEARYMLVSIVEQNDYEIEACINGEYKVRALMFYKTPYMLSCSCGKYSHCAHEAAFYLYLERNLDFFKINSNDIPDLIDAANFEDIKCFLMDSMKHIPRLKKNFLEIFGQGIDERYYNIKLNSILESAYKVEQRYYYDYDLDGIYDDLVDFLKTDVVNVLKIGEYNFASELLCQIGEVLMLESSLDYESWDNLVEIFFEFSTPLKVSLHVNGVNHKRLSQIEEYFDKILY